MKQVVLSSELTVMDTDFGGKSHLTEVFYDSQKTTIESLMQNMLIARELKITIYISVTLIIYKLCKC